MSKVIFLAYSGQGHINPALAVVTEMIQRGETVIFYGTEPVRQKIEATGAIYRAYEQSHQKFFPPSKGFFCDLAYFAKLSETMLPNLIALLQAEQPDYLLLDTKSIWGNLASQILDIPVITLSVFFAISPKVVLSDYIISFSYQRADQATLLSNLLSLHDYLETVQTLNRQYQVRCPNIIEFLGNPQACNIVFTSREFQFSGEFFGEDYKFVGPSFNKRDQGTTFPFERLNDDPLIYISMGTVFNDLPDFYRNCFAAFADQPYQVVLSLGQNVNSQALDEIPPNFIVQNYVPQLEILKRAVIFITHGGMNSTNEALFYHVPLIVMPQAGDQFFVGQRVTELEVGVLLMTQQANPECLRETVAHVLSEPKFKQNAMTIGETLRAAGGYQRAVDEIFAFKQQHELS